MIIGVWSGRRVGSQRRVALASHDSDSTTIFSGGLGIFVLSFNYYFHGLSFAMSPSRIICSF